MCYEEQGKTIGKHDSVGKDENHCDHHYDWKFQLCTFRPTKQSINNSSYRQTELS